MIIKAAEVLGEQAKLLEKLVEAVQAVQVGNEVVREMKAKEDKASGKGQGSMSAALGLLASASKRKHEAGSEKTPKKSKQVRAVEP